MNGRAQKYRFLPMIVLGVVVVLAALGLFWLVKNFLDAPAATPKKVVQEIRIIRPPPPPPDEPPPPPPPEEEEVDIPEPEQQPEPTPSDEPPPSEQLGLDTEGTGEGDGFGLAARKGGRDLLASGGSAYAWYGGLLKNEILGKLQDDKKLRTGNYSVLIRVWVRADGTIERVGLAQTSGDRERDKVIEQVVARIGRVSQGPPADMPQPINLRIVSRG